MFPPSKPAYAALNRKPNKDDRTYLYDQLKCYGKFTGLCWILSSEPQAPTRSLTIPSIEEIIYSEECLAIQDAVAQQEHVADKTQIDIDIIRAVHLLTKGQRDDRLWHLSRKGRLTASNFGCVLNAKRATPSLIKRLLGDYDISRVKDVAWGVVNESEAVKAFTQHTGLQVNESCLWLDQSGVLGASPDGLIGSNHLLEVKCPFSARNMTLDEALGNKSFCLEKAEDGVFKSLKKDHVY
jgi:hypothetical protein